MPKYAPANADGLKPYVVERSQFGRKTEHLVYAADASEAAYEVKGRQLYVYAKARRATPDDVERLGGGV